MTASGNDCPHAFLNQREWLRILENHSRGLVGARLRRKQPRFPISGDATIVSANTGEVERRNKFLRGELIDASAEGAAFLHMHEAPALGSEITVEFRIAPDLVRVRAKVRNCRKQINGYRVGVQLLFDPQHHAQ